VDLYVKSRKKGVIVTDDVLREALRQYPCLKELAALITREPGWIFVTASISGVDCLYGVREGPVVTETITVRTPEDVTVARLRTDDFLFAGGPFPGVLWEYTGSLVDALAQLRELPGHDQPSAPKLLRPTSSMFTIRSSR
jgi:hypothetical protein